MSDEKLTMCHGLMCAKFCLCTYSLLLPLSYAQSNNLTWACDPIANQYQSAVNFKKKVTSVSSKSKPAIWSYSTDQQITCFDSCQLTITWMSNINDVPIVMVLLLFFKVLGLAYRFSLFQWFGSLESSKNNGISTQNKKQEKRLRVNQERSSKRCL